LLEVHVKCAASLLLVLIFVTFVSAADVTGDWQFTAKILNDFSYARVSLKVEGEKMSGNLNELKLKASSKETISRLLRRVLPESDLESSEVRQTVMN